MLEVLSTVLALIQGVLVMLDRRSNWFFYTLQMFFLVLFSMDMRLWGDMTIDSIYFFLGIGGFFLWRKGSQAEAISVYGWKERVVWLLISILAIAVSWTFLCKTSNPLPFGIQLQVSLALLLRGLCSVISWRHGSFGLLMTFSILQSILCCKIKHCF